MQQLTPGAKLHIWTEEGKTFMHILKPYPGCDEELTILSDLKIGMGCNLHYEIVESKHFTGSL